MQNKQNFEHLVKLNDLNINLTDYLVSNIQKPEKLVQIVNKSSNGLENSNTQSNNFANLHFHE